MYAYANPNRAEKLFRRLLELARGPKFQAVDPGLAGWMEANRSTIMVVIEGALPPEVKAPSWFPRELLETPDFFTVSVKEWPNREINLYAYTPSGTPIDLVFPPHMTPDEAAEQIVAAIRKHRKTPGAAAYITQISRPALARLELPVDLVMRMVEGALTPSTAQRGAQNVPVKLLRNMLAGPDRFGLHYLAWMRTPDTFGGIPLDGEGMVVATDGHRLGLITVPKAPSKYNVVGWALTKEDWKAIGSMNAADFVQQWGPKGEDVGREYPKVGSIFPSSNTRREAVSAAAFRDALANISAFGTSTGSKDVVWLHDGAIYYNITRGGADALRKAGKFQGYFPSFPGTTEFNLTYFREGLELLGGPGSYLAESGLGPQSFVSDDRTRVAIVMPKRINDEKWHEARRGVDWHAVPPDDVEFVKVNKERLDVLYRGQKTPIFLERKSNGTVEVRHAAGGLLGGDFDLREAKLEARFQLNYPGVRTFKLDAFLQTLVLPGWIEKVMEDPTGRAIKITKGTRGSGQAGQLFDALETVYPDIEFSQGVDKSGKYHIYAKRK